MGSANRMTVKPTRPTIYRSLMSTVTLFKRIMIMGLQNIKTKSFRLGGAYCLSDKMKHFWDKK